PAALLTLLPLLVVVTVDVAVRIHVDVVPCPGGARGPAGRIPIRGPGRRHWLGARRRRLRTLRGRRGRGASGATVVPAGAGPARPVAVRHSHRRGRRPMARR